MSQETLLIVVIGFLAGMIPAMLLVGFFGGRQVERQRKELQLRYERQVTALRATLHRLMQRIDMLTGERNRLKRANKGLRDVLSEQHIIAGKSGVELERSQADLADLRQQVDNLTNKNLRYEGRLEEARIHQDRMSAQFKQSVAQFSEAERLRRHLLFATNQLRQTQTPDSGKQLPAVANTTGISPEELDVSVIQSIEPLYIERLHESGIHTIADLAEQTPARVAHFAGLSGAEESKEWIARAKAMMNVPPRASA